MAKFVVGDTVMLKSGGPVMTVGAYVKSHDKMEVQCVWFDKADPKYGAFPEELLEKVDMAGD